MSLEYVNGNVLDLPSEGQKFLCHCCNDIGVMGAGVALTISKKWPQVKQDYVKWYKDKVWKEKPFALGQYQLVVVDRKKEIVVVNLIGQEGIGFRNGPPIRYEAIKQGFEDLSRSILAGCFPNASVHMPRIGCGLAGGEWEKIETIIQETFCVAGVPVTVYDYQPNK